MSVGASLVGLAVRRPIGAIVLNLLLVVSGIWALTTLSIREAPDINPPVVSVTIPYPGAAAATVETRVTRIVEDVLAGISGLELIESASADGEADITLTFALGRDIDAASNDVRDRVARAMRDMPEDIDPPEIAKVDANADEVMWLTLRSDTLDPIALGDLVDRLVIDRLTDVEGVSFINIPGDRRPAMRIWLDPVAMALRQISVEDVETALRNENIEAPAGVIDGVSSRLVLRLDRPYVDPQAFERLAVSSQGRSTVRLGEIARIEIGPATEQTIFRANGLPAIGLGIVMQAEANVLEVTKGVREELDRLAATLPGGLSVGVSFDSSVFVRAALSEAMKALVLAATLVALVTAAFLGSVRAAVAPAIAIPASILAALLFVSLFGFTINVLTLLAFVLATGLVVDDAIVVIEATARRIEQGEDPKTAAVNGPARLVTAVLATTIVIVAVLLPIALSTSDVGRLFREFAVTLAVAVVCSSVVALTLGPALAGLVLRQGAPMGYQRWVDRVFRGVERLYARYLDRTLGEGMMAGFALVMVTALGVVMFRDAPKALTPPEDRAGFLVVANTPQGAGFPVVEAYLGAVEDRLLAERETGRIAQILAIGSVGQGTRPPRFIASLTDPGARDFSKWEVLHDVRGSFDDLPGISAFARPRPALGAQRGGRALELVLIGPSYDQLAVWRDRIIPRATAEIPGLLGLRGDLEETRPGYALQIDFERAAAYGVSAADIGRTAQTFLSGRSITTYLQQGSEYDVILRGDTAARDDIGDLSTFHLRSSVTGGMIPLSAVASLRQDAGAQELMRFNRGRALTLAADLGEGLDLGQAVEQLTRIISQELPAGQWSLDYKGETRSFMEAQSEGLFLFVLAGLVILLILAALFESLVLPFVVIAVVPLSAVGGLFGLWLGGHSLNIYSQIALVMLVGLAAKNAILMLEFAEQERARGASIQKAARDAALLRLRPVLMTALSAAASAIPLVLATGAGAEARITLGTALLSGTLLGALGTLLLLPALYAWMRAPLRQGTEEVPASARS